MNFLKGAWSLISGGASAVLGNWQFILGALALGLLLGGAGTWRVMSWKEGAQQTVKVERTVRLVERQQSISTELATIFVPEFISIQATTDQNSKEIPEHVTPQIDREYPVPVGFVRVWNHDAGGPVPGPAAGSDADPSGVPLSDVAQAHNADQGLLNQCRAMNTEWWSWYDQHKAAWDAAGNGAAK